MDTTLFDSELKIMGALWENGDLSAGQLAKIMQEEIGWNRNTTYTVIKKCIAKGVIERYEPGFMCKALISKEKVQSSKTNELIDKIFDGSKEIFFASFLNKKNLSEQDIAVLKQLVNRLK